MTNLGASHQGTDHDGFRFRVPCWPLWFQSLSYRPGAFRSVQIRLAIHHAQLGASIVGYEQEKTNLPICSASTLRLYCTPQASSLAQSTLLRQLWCGSSAIQPSVSSDNIIIFFRISLIHTWIIWFNLVWSFSCCEPPTAALDASAAAVLSVYEARSTLDLARCSGCSL